MGVTEALEKNNFRRPFWSAWYVFYIKEDAFADDWTPGRSKYCWGLRTPTPTMAINSYSGPDSVA